jgi:hypothetical protein
MINKLEIQVVVILPLKLRAFATSVITRALIYKRPGDNTPSVGSGNKAGTKMKKTPSELLSAKHFHGFRN